VVELNNGIVRPEIVLDFLAGDDRSLVFDQHLQDPKLLLGQDDGLAIAT